MTGGPVIYAHLAAALLALPLGAVMLARTKGDATHRLLGRTWAALMAFVAVSSFWIPRFGQVSWIHILSLVTLVSLTIAIWRIRAGDRRSHIRFMTGAYLGLCGAFIGAITPGRLLGGFLWP